MTKKSGGGRQGVTKAEKLATGVTKDCIPYSDLPRLYYIKMIWVIMIRAES